MAADLLRLEHVSKNFGGLLAVNSVSFSVASGMIKGLIGPNGAGKTTAFNMISGYYAPSRGSIFFDAARIDGLSQHRLAGLGLARTFQTVKLFPSMSVLENVMVGRYLRMRGGIIRGAVPFGAAKRDERQAEKDALAMLALVGLDCQRDLPAGELPFGLQRLLEIARALAVEPKLLLLDEPAAGLSAVERKLLLRLILDLRRRGLTVLLIEHDMGMIMDLADEIAVLEYGSLLAEGPPGGDPDPSGSHPGLSGRIIRRFRSGVKNRQIESHRARRQDSQRRTLCIGGSSVA